MSSRPEHLMPPELYYNEKEARKYTSNTRMIEIQGSMTERAIELLNLPSEQRYFILDIGCGSGLSSHIIENLGHDWIGVDISTAMLDVALERKLENGDLILNDVGQGLPFRAGAFDAAVSVSALQWLCNADKSTHNPIKRLYSLFSSLYACLRRGARVVFQFYPENSQQIELITQQSMKAGFSGGLVVDFPNSTKAKKIFLVLFAGGQLQQLPKPITECGEYSKPTQVSNIGIKKECRPIRKRPIKKSRQWILQKKERRRRQGREVRADTKYTGRRRPLGF